MMSDDEFIKRAIGKPWVKLASGPNEYDCWGLIVDYFKQCKNIDLPLYTDGNILDGYISEIESGRWQRSDSGVVFMCFKNDIPMHCGLVFGDYVLHAAGYDKIGQVTYHSMRKIKRLFNDCRLFKCIS